jgi:hypothetical protein
MPKLIDLTGRQFGKLTVVRRDGSDRYSKPKWLCRCDCGREATVLGLCLKNGRTRSCGCLKRCNTNTTPRRGKSEAADQCVPLVQPDHPSLPPEPYSEWTPRERREFGMANPRTQWQLSKRVASGVSITEAAKQIGLPPKVVRRYIAQNLAFRQQIQKVREWATTRRAA